jgi:hypothetical protein
MSTNTKTKSGRGATTIAYLALPEYKVQHQGLPDRISNTSQAAQHQTFCKRLHLLDYHRIRFIDGKREMWVEMAGPIEGKPFAAIMKVAAPA